MKAAVLRAAGTPMTIEDVNLDGPRADEVRVRVVASGLCHSDYHVISGDFPSAFPIVLGHEASGIIVAVGSDVHGFKPGDAVVTCVSMYCGKCRDCQSGHNYVCGEKPVCPAGPGSSCITQNGEHIHRYCELAGFAEEVVVHQSGLPNCPRACRLIWRHCWAVLY